jgi:hypothetical protein
MGNMMCCVPPSMCVTVALACVQVAASCLFTACREGHLEVVKYLCEQGGKELLMATHFTKIVSNARAMCLFLSPTMYTTMCMSWLTLQTTVMKHTMRRGNCWDNSIRIHMYTCCSTLMMIMMMTTVCVTVK